jgi:hypothetical protein
MQGGLCSSDSLGICWPHRTQYIGALWLGLSWSHNWHFVGPSPGQPVKGQLKCNHWILVGSMLMYNDVARGPFFQNGQQTFCRTHANCVAFTVGNTLGRNWSSIGRKMNKAQLVEEGVFFVISWLLHSQFISVFFRVLLQDDILFRSIRGSGLKIVQVEPLIAHTNGSRAASFFSGGVHIGGCG